MPSEKKNNVGYGIKSKTRKKNGKEKKKRKKSCLGDYSLV